LPFIEEGWARTNLPFFKQHVVFEEIKELKRVVENREDQGFSVRVRRFNRRPLRWIPLKKRLGMRTEPCQGAKPVVLETGRPNPPWTPQILPVQIVTIGQLAILAVPAELTTMAGRRLTETVSVALSSSGIKHVVIAGLSNAYAGYVTTQKEYEVQHYEGASTHFGPWTLAAFQQEFHTLAGALRDGKPVPIGPPPLDLTHHLLLRHSTQTPVDPEPDAGFGGVIQDAKRTYSRGETVRVTFFGGHPNHDFRIQSTYLEVQRKEGADWVTIARDWDDETKYRWVRQNGFSQVTIEWTIPTDGREWDRVPSGTYRIRHYGHSKNKKGRLTPYAGTSREFEIVD
jgi:neutral ceramidase